MPNNSYSLHRVECALKDWMCLCVFCLRKIASVCFVEKLRYIQLYEADFVFFQHLFLAKKPQMHWPTIDYFPGNTSAQKAAKQTTQNVKKTFTEDLSRQAWHPMTVVLVDAAQCYDRVNHFIMSLVLWYALIGKLGLIAVLLACLQTMRFFSVHRFQWFSHIPWWEIAAKIPRGTGIR